MDQDTADEIRKLYDLVQRVFDLLRKGGGQVSDNDLADLRRQIQDGRDRLPS